VQTHDALEVQIQAQLTQTTWGDCSALPCRRFTFVKKTEAEPGYNDIGLRDTSSITSDILWYQLIPHS